MSVHPVGNRSDRGCVYFVRGRAVPIPSSAPPPPPPSFGLPPLPCRDNNSPYVSPRMKARPSGTPRNHPKQTVVTKQKHTHQQTSGFAASSPEFYIINTSVFFRLHGNLSGFSFLFCVVWEATCLICCWTGGGRGGSHVTSRHVTSTTP